MTSRRLILALGTAAAFAPPLRAFAQPAGAAPQKLYRIGLLHVGTDHVPPAYVPLKEGMRALGYEEGRNIRYDFRNVDSDAAALAAAHDLVRERVDLVVTFDGEAARAVFAVVKSIPVVMLSGKDGMFDKLRGRLVGCSDYITKPFEADALTHKVAKYLNLSPTSTV